MDNKVKMFLKEVLDFDIEAKEADIIVSDGVNDILCYAQPYENNKIPFKLFAFRANNIIRTSEEVSFVNKNPEGYYSYNLQGKLIDSRIGLVSIGDIVIEIGNNIPKDIKLNEYIKFTLERVDFIEE